MELGKPLIVLGALIMAVGLVIAFGGKIGLGRLPGDIHISGERGSFSFPIVTCIVLSVILSLVGSFFTRR